MRFPRRAFATFVSIAVLGGLVAAGSGQAMAGPPHARPFTTTTHDLDNDGLDAQVRLAPIGAPIWMPVDLHVFSAPIGTAASNYAEFCQTALALLPPPKHKFHPALCVGPGEPHQPPYTDELRQGVAALGFHEGSSFTVREFSNGNAVWLAWMNVPNPGTTGSSPDFDAGPIIPNRLFPIQVTGFSTHDENPYSTLADFAVPKLDKKLDPPFNVDGHSHFPMFIVDNRDFAPPSDHNPTGAYTWHLKMVDKQRAGWQIEMDFVVARS